MEQLKLFYLNINYCGFVENYYYHATQQSLIGDFALYNSDKRGFTLAGETLNGLEKLINDN